VKRTGSLALMALTLTVGLGGGLSGCGGARTAATSSSDSARPAPSYNEIARRYNARASRLDRLWARAAVQLRYTDREGRDRREQGEGHLQIRQPDRLALSVGKLGEVIFWLGGDGERFWWFELGENSVAAVARHENAMKACVGELPLPVHPLDLLDLLGVTSLPSRAAASPVLGPSGRVVVDVPARAGARRVYLDPETMRPARVELWLPGASEPAVESVLTEYERVDIPSEGGVDPRVASRVSVRVRETGAELVLFLSDMNDGSRPGRLSDVVFDFEDLVAAHRPARIEVLDEACDTSAAVR